MKMKNATGWICAGLMGLALGGCEESAPSVPESGATEAQAAEATGEEVKAAVEDAAEDKTSRSESKAELKKRLTAMQYRVTQEDGTEPAFRNEFWDNKAPGVYVDVVSGEPLFASVHKFQSGTGWPSFWQPLVDANVKDKIDRKHGMVRSEVRSTGGDSHLGHVFDDGPKPTGLRYCINSAALRFVPVEKLKEEGLADFAPLFDGVKK